MILVAKISMLVLAVFVAVGGIIGFLKAQSKPSLIAGIVSAALLVTAYSISARNAGQGVMFGAVVSFLLCVVFGIRLKKTGKMMPSGMLLGLCAAELVLLCVTLGTSQP